MFLALVILILLVSFLLALVVLAQNPKGGGISSQFGAGGGAANLMGVKRTGDLLEKLTWGFAVGIIILSLGTHMLPNGSSGPVQSVNQQAAQKAPVSAPVAPTAPGVGAPAGAGAGTAIPAPAPAPGN